MKDKITGIELCNDCRYKNYNDWLAAETDPCSSCVQGSKKKITEEDITENKNENKRRN